MKHLERQERFDDWVKAHAAILHHVANGFAEGDDRNDLMQELLLAVWRAIPAFRENSRPSTFIYRVAHNAALTWRRTQRNYRRKVDQFEELVPEPRSSGSGFRDEDILERVYVEIRRLAEIDRSLILLSLDGLTYREMAEIHGLSGSNVGVRLARAKQELTRRMKGFIHEL